MPNIASALRSEIVRLSKKTSREQIAALQRASTAHRKQIAALRRQIAALEKELKTQRVVARAPSKQPEPDKVRFVAKGLVSLRKRLGLSAEDFGKLIGVTGQSVYKWEAKKATPRKQQAAAIAALRGLGKRQAQAKLAMLPGANKKPASA